MSLRISSLASLLLLGACGSGSSVPKQIADAPEADRVDCAIGDGTLKKDCALERVGETITVRHPDGSFRRFEVDAKGQFGAADGAEEVAGKRAADSSVEVSIGDRRYRFGPGQLTL